jgi:very-short-patch-repair endonuclease
MEAPNDGGDRVAMRRSRTFAVAEAPTPTHVPVDQTAERLAADQHGVVTRAQLLSAGCAVRTVDRRVAAGRLRVVHRGVYLLGPIDHPWSAEMAAALACGPTALVSHSSAGRLWRVLGGNDRAERVRVIVPAGHRRRPGIRIYRLATLSPDERTVLEGIPVTTPARTLYDLASELTARPLERAVAEAIALRLVSLDAVAAMARRHRGRVGAGRLAATVQGEAGPVLTRSPAEERFLRLIRRAGVTAPRANTEVAGHEVDFVWRVERLVVEVDGRAYHSSPRALARDRRRDGDLAAAGFRVMRITWEDIVHSPEALLVKLGKALATRG